MAPPRWRFWAVNGPLIALVLLGFALAMDGLDLLGWMAPAAVLALAVEAPLLRRFRSWWAWLLVFGLGLVVFLFTLGALSGGQGQVGGRAAGDFVGRLDAGVRFIAFGVLFGFWLYPLVVIPNLLLGRWMFGPKPATASTPG